MMQKRVGSVAADGAERENDAKHPFHILTTLMLASL